MNMQDCECVIAIAETGNFSRAAERLYISQPNLSKTVAALERRLGVQLFDRSHAPIQLTEAGDIYLKYARNYVAMETLMEKELHEPKHTMLKIGASGVITRVLLPQVLPAFIESHPNVSVVLQDGGYVDLENFACQNTTDITLISQPTFMSSAVHYEALSSQRLLLVVPEKHPWYDPALGETAIPFPRPISSLAKQQFILPSGKNSTRRAVNRLMADFNLQLPIIAEVNHYETSMLLAEQMSTALAFIDEFYFDHIHSVQRIQRHPANYFYFDKWKHYIQIYAVYRYETDLIHELLTSLRSVLSAYQPGRLTDNSATLSEPAGGSK